MFDRLVMFVFRCLRGGAAVTGALVSQFFSKFAPVYKILKGPTPNVILDRLDEG